jgi:hypothetical protein
MAMSAVQSALTLAKQYLFGVKTAAGLNQAAGKTPHNAHVSKQTRL